MDKQQLMMAVKTGTTTVEQAEAISAALDTHDQVEEARRRIGAFDWSGLLTNLLPVILGLFTGGASGGLIPLINLILSIFKLKPLPVPTPTPGPNPSPFVIPTPVATAPPN